MGPQPFSRGNEYTSRHLRGISSGFNGAATFQSRKQFTHEGVAFPTSVLQWGRNLSVAETAWFPLTNATSSSLQWGRNLSVAETAFVGSDSPCSNWLQWGRNLSVAETRRRAAIYESAQDASMGPQPFSRGNSGRLSSI